VPRGADGELRAGAAAGGRLLTARGRRTRAALVEAARQVFAETPYADVRIVDITARAGVANGTFYTYFDAKEEIFREVAAEVLEAMLQAPRRDPDNTEGDPIRDIEHASRAYFQVVVDNAVMARSIEQVAPADPAVAGARRSTIVAAIKRADRWIRRLQEQGICDGIDPWTTAVALQTMTIRVAYDHLLPQAGGDPVDVDAMARTVSRIWARTVGLEQVEPDRRAGAAGPRHGGRGRRAVTGSSPRRRGAAAAAGRGGRCGGRWARRRAPPATAGGGPTGRCRWRARSASRRAPRGGARSSSTR
jgi:AcrR family transcriptional regulator